MVKTMNEFSIPRFKNAAKGIKNKKKQMILSGHLLDIVCDGIYFVAEIKNNKVSNCRVQSSCTEYFEKLNKTRWLKEAEEYMQKEFDEFGYDSELFEEYSGINPYL